LDFSFRRHHRITPIGSAERCLESNPYRIGVVSGTRPGVVASHQPRAEGSIPYGEVGGCCEFGQTIFDFPTRCTVILVLGWICGGRCLPLGGSTNWKFVATLIRAGMIDAGRRRVRRERGFTFVQQVVKIVVWGSWASAGVAGDAVPHLEIRQTGSLSPQLSQRIPGLGQCLARLSFCSTDRIFQLLPETNPRYREGTRLVVGLLEE
jgi:hypothetical protein